MEAICSLSVQIFFCDKENLNSVIAAIPLDLFPHAKLKWKIYSKNAVEILFITSAGETFASILIKAEQLLNRLTASS